MNVRSVLWASMFLIVISSIMSACNNPSDGTSTPIVTTPLPHSFKGYELYSWMGNNQWHFTLITGTNRNKSIEEIISNENKVTSDGWVKISVDGVDSIKNVLNRLHQHEEIFWAGAQWLDQSQVQAHQIILPPQEIIDSVQEHCKQLELELRVSK